MLACEGALSPIVQAAYVPLPLVAATLTVNAGPACVSLTSVDIGDASGGSFTCNSGTYSVTGGGSDIWNASDGFRFSYETKSASVCTVTVKVATHPSFAVAPDQDVWLRFPADKVRWVDPDSGVVLYPAT